jgi:hypothetical protein
VSLAVFEPVFAAKSGPADPAVHVLCCAVLCCSLAMGGEFGAAMVSDSRGRGGVWGVLGVFRGCAMRLTESTSPLNLVDPAVHQDTLLREILPRSGADPADLTAPADCTAPAALQVYLHEISDPRYTALTGSLGYVSLGIGVVIGECGCGCRECRLLVLWIVMCAQCAHLNGSRGGGALR